MMQKYCANLSLSIISRVWHSINNSCINLLNLIFFFFILMKDVQCTYWIKSDIRRKKFLLSISISRAKSKNKDLFFKGKRKKDYHTKFYFIGFTWWDNELFLTIHDVLGLDFKVLKMPTYAVHSTVWTHTNLVYPT